jgi:hypothetical protein
VLAQVLDSDPAHTTLALVSDQERGLAALAVGNVVKNEYDFQLWVIEEETGTSASTPSVLSSLVHMLQTGTDQSRRRALYAISSAARGNPDVQATLRDKIVIPASDADAGVSISISTILDKSYLKGSAELKRKTLAFVADMLEEYFYIQQQIQNPEGILLEDADQISGTQLMEQLHSLRPLGKEFCNEQWWSASLHTLDLTIRELQRNQKELSEGKVQECDATEDAFFSCSDPNTPRSPVSTLRALAENAVSTLQHIQEACPQVMDRLVIEDIFQRAAEWAKQAGDASGDVLGSLSLPSAPQLKGSID